MIPSHPVFAPSRVSRITLRPLRVGLVLSAACFSGLAQTPKQTNANTAAYSPTAQASPFNGTVVEDIVTRVNDQVITKSDYQRAEQQVDADAKQQGWGADELASRKKDLLRDLIDKELLLSKGKELNITGETELVKRLDEIRKQNHLDSMEDLEKAAQQQGVSYEDFKQNIRNEIVSQQVIREQVSRKIQLTKADIDSFYRAHAAEFQQPEAVHLEEILLPAAADDAAALAKAQAQAADVEAKLKAGTNFEELAKTASSGPTAATGGELGDYKRGGLAKPIEDAVFALKAGGVTQPIRTRQGLLILKVTQHAGGGTQDYAAMQPQVEEAAFMTKMQPALRTYLTTLREQAYIDIRPGYQDAGGTGNSVKPLYSAYTAPGAKKVKTKVQRVSYRETGHTLRGKTGTTQQAAAGGAVNSSQAATTQAAVNTTSSRPVKKQKVRFGQAPKGTLDAAPGNTTASGAAKPGDAGGTQVASNVSSNITGPGVEETPQAVVKKTRFADRAREGKRVKAPTQDTLENQAQGQQTAEELAAQQTQAAPLGLAGDTASKKKPVKQAAAGKTRYADKAKQEAADKSAPPPAQTQGPSPLGEQQQVPTPVVPPASPTEPSSSPQ